MTIGCGMPIMDCWMVRHLSLTPDMTRLCRQIKRCSGFVPWSVGFTPAVTLSRGGSE